MHLKTKFSTELEGILNEISYKRKVEKGTFLFQEGSKAKELFLILKGKVQVSKIIPDGKELTLRMCKEGDIIGETGLFCSNQGQMLNAKVVEDGEVAVIHHHDLENALSKDQTLALEYMKWMNREHRKGQTKLRDLVLLGKKGALYSTLIRLSNSYGVRTKNGIVINTPLTNQALANFCGTSREVVNRMLSELRKKGILSVEKGIITICDINYLRKEIDCENCPIDICTIN